MTVNQFKKECKRTCPDLGSLKLNLAHMALGVHTEIPELEDAIKILDGVNVGEEIADMFWYLNNYLTFRDLELETSNLIISSDNRTLIQLLYRESGLLNDLVKKYVAYGREIDLKQEHICLTQINKLLLSLLKKYGLSQSDVLESNIEKLRVRFPEKFTEENANNRDLATERKILEG